jgi:glycosyltransferase involved in cell wall biosynthesis
MKILQINNCHYRRGGADVVYLNTGELLEQYGHEVIYFSQKNPQNLPCKDEKYFVEGIDFFQKSFLQKIISIPRFLYSKTVAEKLEILIRERRPDIAHIHTYKGTLTPSILVILKKYAIPVVFTLHDYGLLCPHNLFLNGKKNVCTKCLESNNPLNCVINKCNRNSVIYSSISAFEYYFHSIFYPFHNYFSQFISVSQFNYDLHSRKEKYKNKLNLLYNFFPAINTVPINYKFGDYLLFYGRLSEEKGIITLLKAWKRSNSKSVLKIVGDGPQKEEILQFIKEQQLTNVQYLGFKQKTELVDIISNASFVIISSEWYENNPLTIIESYAYGKPVIASKIGGIPEIVENGKTGYLFESGNVSELVSVIKKGSNLSGKQYLEMSENAGKFAEKHFVAESHYNKLIEIYQANIR